MIRATPQMRDFAGRVIAFATRENRSFGTTTPVASAVCEKLRPHWANLMGIHSRRIDYTALTTGVPGGVGQCEEGTPEPKATK